MDKRIKKIVEVLQENDNFLNQKKLSDILGYSNQYINKTINDTQKLFESYGFQLEIDRLGVHLIVLDEPLLEKELSNQTEVDDERIASIIIKLIEEKDYVKIESIAEELYVSRMTVDRLMNRIKKRLAEFDLRITQKPKYGIRIEGSEINMRICLGHQKEFSKQLQQEEMVQNIQQILYEVLVENNYEISDVGFNNLVYHILIAIQRVQSGYELIENEELEEVYQPQQTMADQIIRKLQEVFKINIPKAESKYIVLHLLGKQIIKNSQSIDNEVLDTVDDIFKLIKDLKNKDFTHNFEFKLMIALHIQPMILRLKYGLKQENPLLQKIKREMIQGYELALIASQVIDKNYGLAMDEDEISYLAMHFSLAIEKEKEKKEPMKIVVVCSTGRGTSRLIQYKLMNKYDIKEENITMSSLIQLRGFDLNSYDCILTTIPIPFECPVPVIMISSTMDDKSFEKIDHYYQSYKSKQSTEKIMNEELLFANMDLKSKEEVLHFMSFEINKRFKFDQDLEKALIDREKLSATEVGNDCAMPHPLGIFSDQILFSVLTLKKSILWEKEMVKVVILCIFPKVDPNINKMLDAVSKVVCSKELVTRIIQKTDVETIADCLFGG